MKSGLVCLLLSAASAYAQLDLGSIDGTVTDSSGGVIAGANVQVRNLDTDFVLKLVTNSSGLYSAPLLRPGQYQITVEAPGFQRVVRSGVVLQVQDKLRIDFQMQLGQATESVGVTGDAPLLESESATTGEVINTQQITELPLNGRDWLRLGRLAPGTVSTYYARDRSFTANGMRSIENTYLIDGVSNVSYLRGLDDRRRDVIRPSPDALQEFKVETSLFSAEFGQSAGAVINATLKSGTNRPHGSLFEFGRNAAFDATPFFQPAGTSKPRFNQHQFGGTLSGPIVRDKLFFFFSYEGLRESNPSPQSDAVPTLAMRNGDFSGGVTIYDPSTLRTVNGVAVRDPFQGNQIPMARWDPVARNLITAYPAPNQSGVRNFVYNPASTTTSDQTNTRMDYRIGSKDQIFGRYSQLDSPTLNPAALPPPANLPVTVTDVTHGVAGSWIHNFGPTFIEELRYGFNRIQSSQSTGTQPNNYGIPNALAPGVQGPPVINVTGLNSLGAQGNIPIDKLSETHEVLDNITKVLGNHTLKAGFDFRLISAFTNSTLNGKAALTFNGAYTQLPSSRSNTGAPFGDFLLGLAQTGTVGSRIVADEQGKVYAGYFQDDWKVTRTLTLNIGIRYEVATPYVEANNHSANFIYAPNSPRYGTLALAGVNGNSRELINTDTNNVAPRFGFAWQALKKTVVRGGYGIFYGQDEGYGVVARMVGNPPFFVSVAFPSDQLNPLLTLSGGFPASAIDPKNAVNPAAVGYPKDSPLPYVQQWGLNVQQELVGDWIVEAGYVGNLGLKLNGARDLNQPLPGAGAINGRRPYPTFGSIRAVEPFDRSTYDGLNLRAEHRFTRGFSFLASYTWGHAIDIASAINGEDDYSVLPQNSRNLNLERGDASFDVRQRLATNYIWELPFGRGKAWATGRASRLFGGWSIQGVTEVEAGHPFNITTSTDPSNTGTTERPNRLRSGHLPADQRTINHWFDTAAFVLPAQFTFGNAPRNALHGPGRYNFDTAIHRQFAITERFRLTFRAEAFNAFNHPQFSNPNGTIGSALAGTINSTIVPQRQLQLGLRLAF